MAQTVDHTPLEINQITSAFVRKCIAEMDPSNRGYGWLWIFVTIVFVKAGRRPQEATEIERRRIRGYIEAARNELYGTYCIVGRRGGIRKGSYEGLTSAKVAAEAINGRYLLVTTTGDITPDPVIAARYLKFFNGDESRTNRALSRLFAAKRRRHLGTSELKDRIIRQARQIPEESMSEA